MSTQGFAVAEVRREVRAPARVVWEVVTDWPRHGAYVRATTVRTEGEPGVGQRFVARTSFGSAAFEDVMEVVTWEPPTEGVGRVRLEKRGRVVTGWAEIEVRPLGADRSELVWREELGGPVTLPRPLHTIRRAMYRHLTRLMIERLAKGLAGDAEAGR